MKKIEMLQLLVDHAKDFRLTCVDTILRNNHMSAIATPLDVRGLTQDQIDATLTAFINDVAVGQGLDYGLYTKDLRDERD